MKLSNGFGRLGLVVLGAVLVAGGFGPAQPDRATAAPVSGELSGEGQKSRLRGVRKTRAPVPKERPREGVIVLVPGYPRTPARLFSANGTVLGELPFDDVYSCTLSPDGAQMAVVVREQVGATPGKWTSGVYVVGIAADRKQVGEPLVSGLKFATVAWTADGKSLYVSELRDPPKGIGFLRPGGVALYDVAKRTATVDKELREYCIVEMSPDGKRLLARRVLTDPTERLETVLLDHATRKVMDVGAEGILFTRFCGANQLLGTRAKPKGGPNETEHVLFDLMTKKAVPLALPKEIPGERATVSKVLPSPDGKRLLFLWAEEVPAPPDWPPGAQCWAVRLTTSDLDGGSGRTIFKPEIKARLDEVRNHVFWVDWR
jgi:hypothetical protein